VLPHRQLRNVTEGQVGVRKRGRSGIHLMVSKQRHFEWLESMMSKNVLNGLLVLFWAIAMLGVYVIDEWIDNLPKMESKYEPKKHMP
jgi:hypothetical protein